MDLLRPFRTAKYCIKKWIIPFNQIRLPIANQYHEPDDMLFYAMRAILIDFVEKEKPFIDWTDDEHSKTSRHTDIETMQAFLDGFEEKNNIQQEILDLYIWFKITHPKLEKEIDELEASVWYDRQKMLYKFETEKLLRLVELREHLWT